MREAKDARAEVVRKDREGLLPPDRKLTVGEFLEQWWTWRTLQHESPLRPSTQQSYRLYLDRLSRLLGRIRLADLRAGHIEAAFAQLRVQHPDLGSATRQRMYATLRSALGYAVRAKHLPVNPCDQVDLGFRGTSTRPTVWEPEQLAQFLIFVQALPVTDSRRRLAVLCRLAAMSGLRRGELCGLRWVDVDLPHGTLTVRQQAVVLGYQVQMGAPKTKAGEQRVVALDAETVATLRAWKAEQTAERLAWGAAWVDTGLVFTREDGSGLHPEHVTKTFPKLAKAAGVPVMRLHDLRHLSASLQIAAGVQLAVISKRLGHSTVALTADVYGHLLGDANRSAAEAAADLVSRAVRSAADRRIRMRSAAPPSLRS